MHGDRHASRTEHGTRALCVVGVVVVVCGASARRPLQCTHHDPSMKVTPLTAFMTLPLTFTIKRRVLSTAIIKDDDGEGVT